MHTKFDLFTFFHVDRVTCSFKFLTRLHYCAADVNGTDADIQWGEHEMDYILLIKTNVDVTPNPEEVDEVKYVSPKELKDMMNDKELLWSPWFRIIEKEFLHTWYVQILSAVHKR